MSVHVDHGVPGPQLGHAAHELVPEGVLGLTEMVPKVPEGVLRPPVEVPGEVLALLVGHLGQHPQGPRPAQVSGSPRVEESLLKSKNIRETHFKKK